MLLFFVSLIAICGILYELLLGSLSSYLIGNSVQQFSFVIGFFMSGMWVWAFLSRFLEKNALKNFFRIEILISLIWATSIIFLKFSYIYFFSYNFIFQLIYFLVTFAIWSLVWMEIPLVAEIYKRLQIKTKSIVSDIFTFDYIWWLLASLLFPLVLLPILGLYNTSIFVWSINLIVAFFYLQYLKKNSLKNFPFKKYFLIVFFVFLYFIFLLFFNSKFEKFYLQHYYKEPILETHQTKYQEIVLTKRWDDFRMYLNWNLQFLSLDENIYHEALVDWPMKIFGERKIKVLVLWWWDWLAARNLLKNKNVEKITLVDLDDGVLNLAKNQKNLLALNEKSLLNKKVEIITWDAFQFIKNTKEKYDFIIADFPDPRDTYTAKLFSKEFYIMVFWTLKEKWVFVTQSSNAFFSNKVLFSINKTVESVFWNSLAYHRYLPSFWDWWFVASQKNWKISWSQICPNSCDFFDEYYLKWTENISENTLANPKIIEYYGEGYKKFNL